MQQSEYHISKLIVAQIMGSITPEEQEQLSAWLAEGAENLIWYQEFIKEESLEAGIKRYNRVNTASVYQKLEAKLATAFPIIETQPVVKKLNTGGFIRSRFGIAVTAAAALAAITFGVWFFNYREIDSIPRNDVANINDIAPGKQGATLTLADGKTIELDSAKAGVMIGNGSIAYSSLRGGTTKQASDQIASIPRNDVVAITARTAKGQTYTFTLPDGTKVWLNADSKLTFPSSFTDKNRISKLSGEGYFEVAKDAAHPFIVETDRQAVKVLGTHFNINAYADEVATKTTLLEGSVSISSLRGGTTKQSLNPTILNPNQQATLTNNEIKVKEVDTELAVAWKNNKFVFERQGIKEIMRNIGRWYNVEVIYNGKPTDETFWGSVSRFDNVSTVLKQLEATEKVHFKIEERKIYVLP